METKKRLKLLRGELKKAIDELNIYHSEAKKKYGKEHFWAYDEHYQSLLEKMIMLKYGLKRYTQALNDVKQEK